MMNRFAPFALGAFALFAAEPATAQDATAQDEGSVTIESESSDQSDSAFEGDWLSIGMGVGYGTSYDGSDDYVFYPAPIIQGSLGGIGISPRPAGIAVDLIQDGDNGPDFSFGPSFRYQTNRVNKIKDPVVAAAGKLKTAYELGASTGISFPKVLNPYDSLSFNVDTRWDVAKAHSGMVIEPGMSYFTPLSRGILTALTVSAEYGSGKFNDYYYSVNAAQNAASGLPLYQADAGFNKVGANLLFGFDLDGEIENGGLAVVVVGGYARMLGDAKNSPYTSIRGSADQFYGGLGLGYTF